MARVQILLATYNGEAYLRELLDSLLCQTDADFEILAADDGSTDGTLAALREFEARVPGKTRIVATGRVGGVTRNFMRLVDAADAPYVMLCDQDDVWLPNKVETMLPAIQGIESDSAPRTPVLVHSDLRVVDDQLQDINPSLFSFMALEPEKTDLCSLLLRNQVTGCTTILNHALLERVQGSDPDAMVMHDWWIALVAAAFGRTGVVREATILYRQHGGNTLGAQRWNLGYVVRRTVQVIRGDRLRRPTRRCATQAKAFVAAFGGQLRAEDRRVAEVVGGLYEQSGIARKWALVRYGLLRHGARRNAVLLVMA
jgi:hypothetical protein